MTRHIWLAPLVFPLFGVLVAASGQTRQSGAADPLFQKIASLDAELFGAVNACDLQKVASLFSPDVEFYHDKGGVTLGRQAVVDSIKANLCGKRRRDLVPESTEVHPMDNYGALQIGSHRFCEAGEKPCAPGTSGAAKFIHLWQNKEGTWAITRVLSYDHVDSK
jgi:uncharacterized protein (TIGR02246 family)